MKTVPRSILAFVAATLAPAAVILLLYAAGLVFCVTARGDSYAWELFNTIAVMAAITIALLYVVILGSPHFSFFIGAAPFGGGRW